MLTVRYDLLGLRAGDRVLDLGCGAGRHAFEAARRGARVVAVDLDRAELEDVRQMFEAMAAEGQPAAGGQGSAVNADARLPGSAVNADARLLGSAVNADARLLGSAVNADALRLPFGDGAFDRVIASEVLEHLPDDRGAAAELARVLRPGGVLAVTVPAWLAERVCWALSDQYHAPFVAGGHVRIYSGSRLRRRLREAGLRPGAAHRAHALHTPYWWLKCAVGVADDRHPLVRAYHRLLVWDIVERPLVTRLAERVLSPVMGKSLVVYARKPGAGSRSAP